MGSGSPTFGWTISKSIFDPDSPQTVIFSPTYTICAFVTSKSNK